MIKYVNCLIITMIVSQISILLAPDTWESKKYVKFVCAIVMLTTILSPIKKVYHYAEGFVSEIKSIVSDSDNVTTESDRYADIAYVISSYVCDKYGISERELSITILTNDADDVVEEIHLYISEDKREIADKVEADLAREIKVPIYVFSGGKK